MTRDVRTSDTWPHLVGQGREQPGTSSPGPPGGRGVPPSGIPQQIQNSLPPDYTPPQPFASASPRHGLLAALAPEGDDSTPGPEETDVASPDVSKKKRKRPKVPPLSPAHEAAQAEVEEPSVKPFTNEPASSKGYPPGTPQPTVSQLAAEVNEALKAGRALAGFSFAHPQPSAAAPPAAKAYSDADPGPGRAPTPTRDYKAPMTPASGPTISQVSGEGALASAITEHAGRAALQVMDQDAASRQANTHVGRGQGKPLPTPAGASGIDRPAPRIAPTGTAAKAAPPPAPASPPGAWATAKAPGS